MTRKSKIIIIVLIILLLNYDIPLSNESISGTYANKNYNSVGAHHETAGRTDTLIMKPNGTLYSKFFGNGTYSISNEGKFTQEIVLNPEKPEEGQFHSYLSNKIYEKTKISLGGSSCYEKLKY